MFARINKTQMKMSDSNKPTNLPHLEEHYIGQAPALLNRIGSKRLTLTNPLGYYTL
jgi:hypothetical protein